MGRKARYRKYKAVDPFCTGNRRDLLLRHENVFNKAPKPDDFEQKAPKGFHELMTSMEESKGAVQQKKERKRKKNGEEDAADNKRGKFNRLPWESDNQFIDRVDRMASNIINKEKMDILKSGGDKEMPAKKLTKEKERKLKRIKKKAAECQKKKLEERKEYTKAVKNDRMLDAAEKEMFRDDVKFGEVVTQPPLLTKAPRKSETAVKPGQRQLLLKGLFNTTPQKKGTQSLTKTSKQQKPGTATKVKRRKDMSASEKMRFDQAREAVIKAYRRQNNTTRITLPVLSDENSR